MNKPSKMFNRRGKLVPIDDTMISLRDRLAAGLGYVKRPCSFGPNPKTGVHQICLEREALDMEYHGHPASSYHAIVSKEETDAIVYFWPENVEIAAAALDKERRVKLPKGSPS